MIFLYRKSHTYRCVYVPKEEIITKSCYHFSYLGLSFQRQDLLLKIWRESLLRFKKSLCRAGPPVLIGGYNIPIP